MFIWNRTDRLIFLFLFRRFWYFFLSQHRKPMNIKNVRKKWLRKLITILRMCHSKGYYCLQGLNHHWMTAVEKREKKMEKKTNAESGKKSEVNRRKHKRLGILLSIRQKWAEKVAKWNINVHWRWSIHFLHGPNVRKQGRKNSEK